MLLFKICLVLVLLCSLLWVHAFSDHAHAGLFMLALGIFRNSYAIFFMPAKLISSAFCYHKYYFKQDLCCSGVALCTLVSVCTCSLCDAIFHRSTTYHECHPCFTQFHPGWPFFYPCTPPPHSATMLIIPAFVTSIQLQCSSFLHL